LSGWLAAIREFTLPAINGFPGASTSPLSTADTPALFSIEQHCNIRAMQSSSSPACDRKRKDRFRLSRIHPLSMFTAAVIV
jgi:hypothetical protein